MRPILTATMCWMAVAAAGLSALLAQEPPLDRVAKIVAPLVDEQTLAVVHANLTAFDAATTIDIVARGLQWPEDVRDHLQVQFAPIQVVTQSLPETAAVDAILVISFSDLAQLPFFLALPIDNTTPAKAIALEARCAIGESWRREVVSEEIGDTLITGAPSTLARLKKAKPVARPEIAAAFQAVGQGGIQFAIVPSAAVRKLAESLAPKLPERLGGGSTKTFTQGIVWSAVGDRSAAQGHRRASRFAIGRRGDGDVARSRDPQVVRGPWRVPAVQGERPAVRRTVEAAGANRQRRSLDPRTYRKQRRHRRAWGHSADVHADAERKPVRRSARRAENP